MEGMPTPERLLASVKFFLRERRLPNRRFDVKHWSIRSKLALWTAVFLTIELLIFGLASGWVIYNDKIEAFAAIRNHPTSATVISKEMGELVFDLTSAYKAALLVTVLVSALGIWWITRNALQTLLEVAKGWPRNHPRPPPGLSSTVPAATRASCNCFAESSFRFELPTVVHS
jgi:hypothetical protein